MGEEGGRGSEEVGKEGMYVCVSVCVSARALVCSAKDVFYK